MYRANEWKKQMYSVVGCPDCESLKIVADRPKTTKCPRCGRQTKFEKLRKFYQSDDLASAREIRARLNAEQSGHTESYAELDPTELERAAANAGIDDEEYLTASGLDPDEIAAAGKRATSGAGSKTSRKQIVLDALSELENPTEQELIAYTADREVSAEFVRDLLDRLKRRGELIDSDGRYRLL